MSELPKNAVDPDATVMLPSDKPGPASDPDATVMIPAARVDDDATVMMLAQPADGADDDATVMMPARHTDSADDHATMMVPAGGLDAGPDPEATITIPTPGRKRVVSMENVAELPSAPPAPPSGREAGAAELGALGGLNPLVGAANALLAVVPQIRHTLRHADPEGLRASLREGVEAFERDARAAGCQEDAVSAARYALSALLDESAASTPWGAAWPSSSGEKFFEHLHAMSADPAARHDVLEFFYICLALGFEGRYRGAEGGREALAERRAGLFESIKRQNTAQDAARGDPGELSGHWRGVQAPLRRSTGGAALWAAGCGAALLLAALYTGYSISLGSLSDPVARELAQLKIAEPAAAVSAVRGAAPPLATARISEQLAAEIAGGKVSVTDAPGLSTIVIRSDRLFASGSARPDAAFETVIRRIAEALDKVPGTIVVSGHTDDVPIRTARFPSNWELSTERAASVVKLMAVRLKDPARLRTEGLADSAPVAPNDSAANRARNRRVTILLRSEP